MQDKVFYSICCGFIFGVFLRSILFLDFYLVVLFTIITSALFLFFTLISRNKWGVIVSIFFLTFCLGIFRFHVFSAQGGPALGWESEVGEEVTLSGEIIDEPSIKENNQQLTVTANFIGRAPDSLDARPLPTVKILLSTSLDENYKYGDEINFSGKLEKPKNFITDQGKKFDYVNYLRKDGINYVMNYVNIEVISRGNGNFIRGALFSVKEKFLEKINVVLFPPEGLLMGGLILGEKSSFDQALRTSFVNTGTIHIVALSGYNVTIVAEWIMKLFSFLPMNFGIGVGIFTVLLFVLMTGGSSTAIRAGIMATLALVARATGRNYDVARALVLAGVVMILLNPFVLVYDVSFQLSFIATVAVIFIAPRIEKYFLWVPDYFKLRDIMSVTCAAYIFVLPYILYKMGSLSVVALPANILILPLIPFTMMLGFLTGSAGLVWHVISVPLGYISYLFLHYELEVISFFSNLPFAAFSFPNFPLWLTILIYAYFIYRLFGRNIKNFFTQTL